MKTKKEKAKKALTLKAVKVKQESGVASQSKSSYTCSAN